MDAPSGWYPDPRDPRRIRWWDGTGWTEHTAPLPTDMVAAQIAEAAPPKGRSVLPLVAGVVAFLVLAVGAVAILLNQRTAGPSTVTGPQAGGTASATPTPSRTGPTPETTRTPTPGATSTQGGAAGTTLETFRPPDGFISTGVGTELIDGGDTTKDPTLDGWCSQSYATEKDRVARRQWALTVGGERTGWSVEVVAYSTAAQAEAALAEFTARTKACRDVTFVDQGVQQTQNLTSTPRLPTITGVSASEGRIRIDYEQNGATSRGNSVGLVQQRGRYLSVIWAGQQSDFSSEDDAVLAQLRQQQADALLATG